MITLLLQFLIAHAIGDFVIQPSKWVVDKKEKKHKSKYLYLHVLVHAIALIVLLRFDFSYWLGLLLIVISHYVIDLIKVSLEKKTNSKWLFLLDQVAHLAVILGVVQLYEPFQIDFGQFYSIHVLLFILALICIVSISSVLMKLIMSKWELDEDDSEDSLEKAGKYIGILERLFVFGFIILNQWEAIGLLIAAKSVFRFGDLSKAKDRKLTEYILIGTLLSFGLAIGIGLLYKYAVVSWVN